MKEINKKTLIEALSSLREHNPPESIWENINFEMELGPEEIVSRQMLMDLPEHNPPEKVWYAIEKDLKVGTEAKVVPFRWRKTLAIAASFSLLFAAYFLLQETVPATVEGQVSDLKYTTETVDVRLTSRDWEEDADDFEVYKQLCNAKQYICEHPEFITLQEEFDELSDAVKELEMAMGNYGTNANLVIQIKEIELERTDIFKKMMVMLI